MDNSPPYFSSNLTTSACPTFTASCRGVISSSPPLANMSTLPLPSVSSKYNNQETDLAKQVDQLGHVKLQHVAQVPNSLHGKFLAWECGSLKVLGLWFHQLFLNYISDSWNGKQYYIDGFKLANLLLVAEKISRSTCGYLFLLIGLCKDFGDLLGLESITDVWYFWLISKPAYSLSE